jgi:hypothetical protein
MHVVQRGAQVRGIATMNLEMCEVRRGERQTRAETRGARGAHPPHTSLISRKLHVRVKIYHIFLFCEVY